MAVYSPPGAARFGRRKPGPFSGRMLSLRLLNPLRRLSRVGCSSAAIRGLRREADAARKEEIAADEVETVSENGADLWYDKEVGKEAFDLSLRIEATFSER
jgi:hypothetical protein